MLRARSHGEPHYPRRICTRPLICNSTKSIDRYPYVGFVYSGYPYGAFGPATGYPRGFYSPYTGYPYAEPYPYFGRRAHRHVRHHVARSAPVHYRATHAPMAR
jgi:hypothetical protein